MVLLGIYRLINKATPIHIGSLLTKYSFKFKPSLGNKETLA